MTRATWHRNTDRSRARGTAALLVLLLPFLGLAAPVAAAPAVPSAASGTSVTTLTTDDLVEPLGTGGEAPRFGWQLESDERGVRQSAYEIRVAREDDDLASDPVWSSGVVASDQQIGVVYGGPALEPSTRYRWQVRAEVAGSGTTAWSEPASFETALLAPEDWQAGWIGDASADVDAWTDYVLTADLTVAPGRAFGFYLRAESTGSAYMWQLDDTTPGHPSLRPHRRDGGAYSLLDDVDLTSVGLAADVLKKPVELEIALDGATIVTTVDGIEVDRREDARYSRGFVGIRLDGAGQEGGTVHEMTVTDGSRVLYASDFATGANPFGAGQVAEDGLRLSGPVDALWSADLPLLRTEFATPDGASVARARLSATAFGIYEMSLNGERVGDQSLAPGWTDYRKRIQFQTYDVTDLVRAGRNAIGASLGEGWYAGHIGWFGDHQYGTTPALLAQLEITYDDGTTQVVGTDRGWTSAPSPFVEASLQMGETFDARRVQDGWDTPDFDDAAWQPVRELATDATERVVPQEDQPVRVTQTLTAVERTEPTAGGFVYDLGQNMAGVASVRMTGEPGTVATIRHAEVLNTDGTLYTANLRGARATDRYVFGADGTVTYTPRFTQHGFRYVEITGLDEPPAIEDVHGVVLGSDLPVTGTLDTSDPMLDQLQSNIQWGQRGNFISVPTDTPARDERMGYTGDLNAFIGAAAYNMDSLAFVTKFLRDVRDNQDASGNVAEWVPRFPSRECCDTGTGWSDAIVTLPWTLWQRYGDTAVIEENYDAILHFFDYLETRFPDGVRVDGPYGDWLNLADPTPPEVLGTAYYAYDARLMSEMAAAVGRDDDARRFAALAEEVTDVFVDRFVADDGRVGSGSQTSYALALGMDLVPDDLREAAGDRLVANIEAHDHHLTTGFLGTPWLLEALGGVGRWEAAYGLLQQTTIPSWGYEVEMGATTMWERWDSMNPDGSFNDPGMNSFNHYAFGAVGDWMYQNVAGIRPLDPGYRTIEIAPRPGGTLTSAQGSYESRYGTVSSSWTQEGDTFTLAVQVPPGTTATVRVPATDVRAVRESGTSLDVAAGVEDVATADGAVVVTVGSGTYELSVDHVDELLAEGLALAGQASDVADGLHDDGSLDDATHDAVVAALADVSQHALAAIGADRDEATTAALAAVEAARTARAALGDQDPSDVAGLAEGVDQATGVLEDAAARLAGFRAEAVLGQGGVLPGATVDGEVQVRNDGTDPVTGVRATPDAPAGWSAEGAELGDVAAGASATGGFSLRPATSAAPGDADVPVRVVGTVRGTALTVTAVTTVRVSSPLTVESVSVDPATSGPGGQVVARVAVRNAGSAAVDGRVHLVAPAGWEPAASSLTRFGPGEDRTVEVRQVVPVTVDQETLALRAEVRVGESVYARGSADLEVAFGTPDDALDHVDLGDGASEAAHRLEASPASGTGTEAGLTRRYTTTASGNHFAFDMEVPVGEPFVVRALETFDQGARLKRYTVLVDDHVVQARAYRWGGTTGGSAYYQVLVDDPAAFSTDGTARITISRDTDEDWDASLADVWTLAAPDEGTAPAVDVTVSPRCLAGKAYLAVRAENVGASPLDITLTTPFGSATFEDVAPGKNAYQSFATRTGSIDEGTVTVSAQDAEGGPPSEQTVEHPARSC